MRKRTAAGLHAGIFMALLYPSVALAQAQSQGVETARGLSGQANLRASYEDNVFRQTTLLFPGDRKGDFRLTPSATLRYDVPVGRQGFFVQGNAGYNFYARNDNFNRGWWGADAGVNWHVGTRCSGLASAGYSESQSDFGDLGVAIDNLEKRKRLGFDISCAGPVGIGLVGGVDYSKTDNSASSRILGDLRTFGYNAGLLYRSVLIGDITVRYMHEDRKYPNRFIATPLGLERDGLQVDRVALNVTRPLGARLTGSAGISYIWTDPDVSVFSSFKGMGWNGDLSYLVSPKLSFGVSASRDVTSSAAIDSSYQVTRTLGGWATYKLSSITSLSLGASDMRRSFRGTFGNTILLPSGPFVVPVRTKENTQNYYAELGYTPNDRWGASLRYQYSNRNSDGSFFDYDGNSVILNVSYRY